MPAGEDGTADRFPVVGMRVLAVDDDPTCLKVLENLLRKCQYQVATANLAASALRMLRENPDGYDLVISDVNMPDMDGFELLERVGLEMDLPVIMLSAHSDTKRVMKGITHGACDYLLKPVRIEELKNIWQHVIRNKKFEPKDQNKVPNQDIDHLQAGAGQRVTSSDNGDQKEKSNRKRKDPNDDEEEDGEDDGSENNDPSTQKKPRLVWTPDLHGKFVGAVNQLGLDKAVPKKILYLMNAEGVSRENVASHLQKYRHFLKGISQQANMVALAGRNSFYMHMDSLNGFGDFHTLAGSGRFSNTSLASYPPGGVLGRLNSSAGVSLREISSSGLIQPSPSQNLTNSLNSLGAYHSAVLPPNQSASLFQGIPTPLDFNQLQHRKIGTPVTGFNSRNDPTTFVGTSYHDTSSPIGCSSNSFGNSANIPLILQGNPHQAQNRDGFSNQSSLRVGPSRPSSTEIGPIGSSTLLDQSRSNDSWQSAVQMESWQNELFSHAQMPTNNMIDGVSSSTSHILTNPIEMSSSGAVPVPWEDSGGVMQYQRGLIGNSVQNTNFAANQMHRMGYNYGMNNTFSAINSLLSSSNVIGSLSCGIDQDKPVSSKNIDASLITNSGTPSALQQNEAENSPVCTSMRSDEYLMEQTKAQDGFIHESLNDLLNAMDKRV